MKILIRVKDVEVEAKLNENSEIVKELVEKMPIMARATTTQGIVYFPVPIVAEDEKPTAEVQVGDIAYWKNCGCVDIFIGKTKHSDSNDPKSIEPVSIIGRVTGNVALLETVEHRDKIELEIVQN